MCQHAAVFTQHAMINHWPQTSFCPSQKFPVLKALLCLIGPSAAVEIVNKLFFIYDVLFTLLEMCPALFYSCRNPSANRFLFNHSTGQESQKTLRLQEQRSDGYRGWVLKPTDCTPPQTMLVYFTPNAAFDILTCREQATLQIFALTKYKCGKYRGNFPAHKTNG